MYRPIGLVSEPATTAATGTGDVKLRQLWSEFIRHRAAYRAAWERYHPAYDAFIAELPRYPQDVLAGDHMRVHNWLWRKHGLEELWNAWDSATDAMEATSAAILAVEAEGLLGIGIKLAALPVGFELDSDDLEEARHAVLMDIERLLGVTLEHAVSSPIFTLVPKSVSIFAAIEDHQAKFEAVRTLTSHDDNLKPGPAPGDSSELVAALAASIAARKTLVSTAPTTLAGLVAVLSYVHDQQGWPSAVLFDKAESRRFIRLVSLVAGILPRWQSSGI